MEIEGLRPVLLLLVLLAVGSVLCSLDTNTIHAPDNAIDAAVKQSDQSDKDITPVVTEDKSINTSSPVTAADSNNSENPVKEDDVSSDKASTDQVFRGANGTDVNVQAEDESCNTPVDKSELPIVRVLRQISFPQNFQGNRPVNSGGNRFPQQQNPNFGGGSQRPVPTGQCNNCVPIVKCSFLLAQVQTSCNLPDAQLGVCCPQLSKQAAGQGDNRLFTERRQNVRMKPISSVQVNQACEKGINFQSQVGNLENQLMRTNQVVGRNDPARGHLKFFKVTRTARQANQMAQQIAQASKSMMNDLQLNQAQGTHGLRQFQVRNSILSNNCPQAPRCNQNAKYRSMDGTCNNLRNPLYGKSETAFQRILPPVYDDGVSAPRTRSAAGGTLPNVRMIASSVLVDRDDPDQQFTLSVMQWAQFIDHDLTHAPFDSLPNGEGIQCCPNGRPATGQNTHPQCWPISIAPNDPFYQSRGLTCMNFVRSMLGLNQECTFGYAEQMNQITHWLDASQVYGSSSEEANRLRLRRGGQLSTSSNNLLPLDQTSRGDCEARQQGALCYHAGDSRVNEQPGLTAIHILFHREHNRVARALQQANGQWSDEAIYQEARRIVTAEIQHIIYNEWLPIIVGPNFMQSFGINPEQGGYSFDYNPNVNPSMNNEFATGAFRFGHSLVQGRISLFNEFDQRTTLQLRDNFNSPHVFQQSPGIIDQFIRSFSRQAIQKFDSFVTDDLSNHLFENSETNFGMDLMSLNLHRGRDHAIAPYNAMREICGLPRARNFGDFNDQIPSDIVNRLSQMYSHVDDVDFFVGGMSEKPVSGGLLGWTFLCVVGDQFARVKKGDRFFYDLGGNAGSFTPNQLEEIRKASWARIMCDNSDNIQKMQPLGFRRPDNRFNPIGNCRGPSIPSVNLAAWQGERPQA